MRERFTDLAGWLGIAGLVVAFDQVTKYVVVTRMDYLDQIVVLPFFKWVRWHNDGAAFSFLSGAGGWQHYFFVTLATGFSAYLIYELWRLSDSERRLGWVFSLILGGAIGNLLDRLIHGYVVDFIRFEYGAYGFPAFNVADSALFCGAALWILLMLLDYLRDRRTDPQGP